MPNFLAEFTGRSLLAICCFIFVANWPGHLVQAQENGAAGKGNAGETETGNGEAAAAANQPPVDEPLVIGSAKDAKEYKVIQKQAIQHINLNTGFLSAKILNDYRRQEDEYQSALKRGIDRRNPAEEQSLRSGLDYRSILLSDPDVQNVPTLFQKYMRNLTRDIKNAAPVATISNAKSRAQLRELVCQIVFGNLKQLIQKGNLPARSAALEQLLNLQVVPAARGQRLRMYGKVDVLLVEVMRDPNQPDAVKLRTANVMKKYMQKGDTFPQVEMAFAEAIAAELKRPFLEVPYLNSLCSAMEWVQSGRKIDGNRDPVVFCAMVDLMQNKDVAILIRCRAARVLGRAGYDRNIDFEPLAWGTANLTIEAALAYHQAKNPKDPSWARCGWYLYTALHHEKGKETSNPDPFNIKGFLNREAKSETVRAAYEKAVPAMAHMMDGGNPNSIRALAGPLLAWLQKNKPANMKCDPACPEILSGN